MNEPTDFEIGLIGMAACLSVWWVAWCLWPALLAISNSGDHAGFMALLILLTGPTFGGAAGVAFWRHYQRRS